MTVNSKICGTTSNGADSLPVALRNQCASVSGFGPRSARYEEDKEAEPCKGIRFCGCLCRRGHFADVPGSGRGTHQSGGQTMNPSTEDYLMRSKGRLPEWCCVLPITKNFIMGGSAQCAVFRPSGAWSLFPAKTVAARDRRECWFICRRDAGGQGGRCHENSHGGRTHASGNLRCAAERI